MIATSSVPFLTKKPAIHRTDQLVHNLLVQPFQKGHKLRNSGKITLTLTYLRNLCLRGGVAQSEIPPSTIQGLDKFVGSTEHDAFADSPSRSFSILHIAVLVFFQRKMRMRHWLIFGSLSKSYGITGAS